MKNILLTLLSAFLFSVPWFGLTSLTLFFAFVPLLFIQQREDGKRFVWYCALSFIFFNLFTVWWVWFSAPIGVFAATLAFTVLFTVVMALYNRVWKKAKRALAYTVFVSAWVAAEYLYLNGEISFPWLNLGNGFAIDIRLVQWYEYSGALGGTLWVLVANIVIYEALSSAIAWYRGGCEGGILRFCRFWIAPLVVVGLPAVVSLCMYSAYEEQGVSVEVAVLQPNVDPYKDKFSGMSQEEQEDLLLGLMAQAPRSVRYFVAPETALDNGFWIETLDRNRTILRIRDFMKENYPNSEFILGLTTYKRYDKSEYSSPPTETARVKENLPYYYDIYNSAIQIDTSSVIPLYHKSRLVIGVEMLPYQKQLPFIKKWSVDLGGTSGMLGYQEEASVFPSFNGEVNVGTAICYESVYGEYFAGFVRKGARAMFVITNDGWWGDTFGYRQHFSYSRIRAVETRRSVARSANTGISGFINQRGEVVQRLGWDKRGILVGEVMLNEKETFYTKYGDTVGRAASYVFVLSLLYYIAYRRRKKDYLYE